MASATRVLVTGASGFVGTHVVQQLQRLGYMVRGTVRSKSNEQKVKPLLSLCPGAKHELELVEADLMKPDGWNEAVADCTYVLHIASPLPNAEPADENEVIKPAVEGTLHVMRACKEAKCVKRVVLTSSVAAISGGYEGGDKTFTEADWTDVEICKMPYYKSKTLAEQAAWDFLKKLPKEEKFELATINPTYIVGPVLCGSFTASMEVPKRLLCREMSMVPRMNFAIVDVRDVAASHIAAMTVPEANNQRHIADSGQNRWFSEIAQILEKEFKAQGYKVPTSTAPYPLLWLISRFDKTIKMILPRVGKEIMFDNTRMKSVLGVQPHNVEDTIIDMAYSMIENGYINKTKEYKPREGTN